MSRYSDYRGNKIFTIKKNKEKEFMENIQTYDFFNDLFSVNPPNKIGECWIVVMDDDTINHFHPDEVIGFWEDFSLCVNEAIEFIILDEEFPILNDSGYACLLECSSGECEVLNLKLEVDKIQENE